MSFLSRVNKLNKKCKHLQEDFQDYLTKINSKNILPADDDEKWKRFSNISQQKSNHNPARINLLSEILNVHTSGEQSLKFDLKTQTANCIKNEIGTVVRVSSRCTH